MILVAGYWLFLLSACALMACFGQREERIFVGWVTLATIFTLTANARLGMVAALPYVALIDAALWGAGLYYTFKFNRYWPIWFSGFHLNALATEVGSLAFPNTISASFANLAGAWALPALGAAAIGVVLDRRQLSLSERTGTHPSVHR